MLGQPCDPYRWQQWKRIDDAFVTGLAPPSPNELVEVSSSGLMAPVRMAHDKCEKKWRLIYKMSGPDLLRYGVHVAPQYMVPESCRRRVHRETQHQERKHGLRQINHAVELKMNGGLGARTRT